MAVALVFAMKLRDPNIHLDDDLEEFMTNIQPPITEENYSEILRRSERSNSEITDSAQSNDEDDRNESDGDDDDDAILATLSDETENVVHAYNGFLKAGDLRNRDYFPRAVAHP